MGFFDLKAICAICEKEVGLNRHKIADKNCICPSCFKDAGFNIGMAQKPIKQMQVADVHSAIKVKNTNNDKLASFTPTKKIGSYLEFDDNQKKWLLLSGLLGKRDKSKVYSYSDIVGFELLEDGESVSQGGLGRALVGGALFGGAGAVVGSVTGKKKSKSICNSLKVKITINDINNPTLYISFLSTATKKDSFVYKSSYQMAHECLSTFQIICDNQEALQSSNNISVAGSTADEIRKYKQLFDEGILTQEEFDAKKKALLEV